MPQRLGRDGAQQGGLTFRRGTIAPWIRAIPGKDTSCLTRRMYGQDSGDRSTVELHPESRPQRINNLVEME